MLVTFFGASDDLIEIAGCPGADEFYVNEKDEGWFKLIHDDGQGSIEGLIVTVQYRWLPTWTVGLTLLDEGIPLPPWPIRIDYGKEPSPNYSPMLSVDAPEGTYLERIR